MQVYTLTKVTKMGERHPEYGQTWWGDVKEIDFPVMFNTKVDYVGAGQVLTADEQTKKTSAKGTEYMRLSKVKLAEAEKPQAESSPSLNTGNFKLIYSELRKQTALLQKLVGEPSEKATEQMPDDLDMSDDMPEDFLEV